MKKFLLCILLVLSLVLYGCSNTLSISYPDDPIKFETYSFTDPDNTYDSYGAFDYNSRTYIAYAPLNNSINQSDIDSCIGSIVLNGKEIDEWVVKLKYFNNDDCLMIYYPNGGMQPPVFYRAIDTKNQTVEIPDYISAECADYWK